jgi:hypothetical protein
MIYVYTKQTVWNPNSNTLEHERPQHDLPAAYAIAQQYSSSIFVLLPFHCRKEKIRCVFKNAIISILLDLLILLVWNCVSWDFCGALITAVILVFHYMAVSRWPRRLKRGSAAVPLLELRVRIPPGSWMCVSYECCVPSGRGLCDGPISRPEESYWVRFCVCVIECDQVQSSLSTPTVSR